MTLRSVALAAATVCLLAGCGKSEQAAGDQRLIQLDGAASSLKVNGQIVPEALVEAYARKRGWEVRDPGQRDQAYDQLAELLAVAMEADKRGLLAEDSVRADLAQIEEVSVGVVLRFCAPPEGEQPRDDDARENERDLGKTNGEQEPLPGDDRHLRADGGQEAHEQRRGCGAAGCRATGVRCRPSNRRRDDARRRERHAVRLRRGCVEGR